MSSLSDPARLTAIERSGLLRHPQHDRLVHLCYVATELLNVDAVQINVVTDTQQIFLAEWPRVKREPIPMKDGGCKEVVLADATIIIEDTATHPLSCYEPWSRDWGAYLGVRISLHGQVLGSMCALNVTPRSWPARDVMALESLSGLATESLD